MATTAPAAGSNVNVSIRVLSPGNDGPVDQVGTQDGGIAALATTEPSLETPATGEAGPASVPAGAVGDNADDPSVAENAEQYQGENSQYQSDPQSDPATWHWSWYLALDCGGNAVSESEETGAQSSLDWAWEWTWEWSCDSPPRPPPLEAAAVEITNVPAAAGPTTVSNSMPTGAEQSSEGGADGEPWRWTWTFTFCGETVSATMPISTATPLAWQWDWIWSWTCEQGAPGPAPSAPAVSSPSPSVQDREPSGTHGVDEQGAGLSPAGTGPASFDPLAFPTWVISLSPLAELFPLPRTELLPLAKTFEAGTFGVAVDLEIPSAPPELTPVLIATGTR